MTAPEESARPTRRQQRSDTPSPAMGIREEDLEPHAALRYVARLLKVLAVLLLILMVANFILGLVQEGPAVLAELLVGATQMIVFAGLLWAAGDLSLMLIESNHDLRAVRILMGRMNGRLQRMEEQDRSLRPGPEVPAPGATTPDRSGTGRPPPG